MEDLISRPILGSLCLNQCDYIKLQDPPVIPPRISSDARSFRKGCDVPSNKLYAAIISLSKQSYFSSSLAISFADFLIVYRTASVYNCLRANAHGRIWAVKPLGCVIAIYFGYQI